MSPPQAKRFEYAASVDRAGRISAEGGPPVALGDEWTPEALILAGLARCTLKSLTFHAQRENRDVAGSAAAAGAVTRREADGRYAFAEVRCALTVDLDPPPAGEELLALLAKAERGCFISASLTVTTDYRWRVNGEEVTR